VEVGQARKDESESLPQGRKRSSIFKEKILVRTAEEDTDAHEAQMGRRLRGEEERDGTLGGIRLLVTKGNNDCKDAVMKGSQKKILKRKQQEQ